MKKLFYSVFTAVTMLLAVTSCSQEEDFAQSSQQTTSFNISLNGAVGSRALGDGTSANELHYQVFLDGESVKKDTVSFTSGLNLDLPLLNGETYSIVFWAQNSGCSIYDLDNLSNIKVNYANVSANQESYDAFYNALVNFKADGNNHRVELRRPFAQLNLGTGDWSDVIVPNATAPVTATSVKVKGLADTFCPLTGVASGNVEATFDYSAFPECTFTVNNVNYQYLSLNYLLVPGKKAPQGTQAYVAQTNADKAIVNLTFNLKRGDKVLQPISVPNAPLQRNWRTNIIGDVLTGTDFDIVIKPETDDYHNVEISKVGNVTEIQEAIDNAKEDGTPTYLEVTNDMTFGNSEGRSLSRAGEREDCFISIPAGVNVVLDLKEYSINGFEDYSKSFGLIKNSGTLTVKGQGGKMTLKASNNRGWSAYSSVISNNPGGNLTVESGVVIEHEGGTDMAYGIDNLTNGKGTKAVTTIDGATIKSSYTAIRQFLNGIEATNELYVKSGILEGENRSIWMQDPSANSNTGKLVVEGSDKVSLKGVVKLSMTAGSTEWPLDITIPASVIDEDSQLQCPETLPVGYSVENVDGVYTKVVTYVAMVGEVGYTTLQKAVNAVQDGETIILLDNITIDNSNAGYQDGEYTDGVRYTGDKSFTIDFNGKTLTDDDCVNDYLIYINNKGEKDNEITFMNGTIISKNGCWSTICVNSSAATHATELNLVGMSITNSNAAAYSGNPVVRARENGTVNVGENTVIISDGASYGIAANTSASIVNIKAGAKVIQKNSGTTGGNSVFAAVGGKGTINIYDGSEITSDRYGVHTMTTGTPVVNVFGGTITASVALKASTNGGTGELANIYVTGGNINGALETYTDNGHIVVSGGTFSVDPIDYLVEGYKIKEGTTYQVVVDPIAKIGDTEYDTLEDACAAAQDGSTITILRDVTLSAELELPAGITLNGNGKQINGTIYAGGNLTFVGHTKVTSFSASYYNRVITIGEGACLEVTGTGRVTLGYGNTFNITGSVENAKTADKTKIQPSLIIPAGISITGGNGATFNVTDAYVNIGSTTSKNSVASGTFALNFNNSIAEFTKELAFAEPTSGKNPTFNINVTNSVLTTGTKLILAAPNSNMVVDNSTITLATYFRNSGEVKLINGSTLTGATTQFGENGGNNGAITVDASKLTINASSTGHALDGKGTGSITLKNGAEATVTYYKAMTVDVDATSRFTGVDVK